MQSAYDMPWHALFRVGSFIQKVQCGKPKSNPPPIEVCWVCHRMSSDVIGNTIPNRGIPKNVELYWLYGTWFMIGVYHMINHSHSINQCWLFMVNSGFHRGYEGFSIMVMVSYRSVTTGLPALLGAPWDENPVLCQVGHPLVINAGTPKKRWMVYLQWKIPI